MSAGIDERGDAFASGEAILFVLGVDGFGSAAFANFLFLIFEGGKQLDHALGVFFELRRFQIDAGFQDGHAKTSPCEIETRKYTKQSVREAKGSKREDDLSHGAKASGGWV